MKRRLYMVQVNNRYGENVYLPYSAGLLWAYARTFSEIDAAYEMVDFLYLKESIDKAVARLDAPDLIAISCYIWNWEWSKAFAAAVKKKWPRCVIIVGGVQVQDESPSILVNNPMFDFAIYGEGEGAFADFLREQIKHTQLAERLDAVAPWSVIPSGIVPDYSTVGSLIWWRRDIAERIYRAVVNPRREFVDIDKLRSPYLDGVFDFMLDREKRWQVLQETARGCPYSCTFCAWGQAALSDLRLFSEERVLAELDWFGQHHVDYLDNADANYGIVKRDVELTRALVATKEKYGYPRTFRTSFAKNSNEVIWTIANLLHDADMLKSVTLAMQSMDDAVLVNIKRKNIKFDKFEQLLERYEEAGIPTYTELILGLPGESLKQFTDGIEKNLEAGQHRGLFVYINLMLNNTEQAKPSYIEAHGIRTLPLKAMLSHGTPDDSVPREIQPVVVETASMSHDDWKQGWFYAKIIEVFHSQGLLQDIAIRLHERDGLPYWSFYLSLMHWLDDYQDTLAGCEMINLMMLLERVLDGGLWDCVDPRLGDISWPPEEFAFARICMELDTFYAEIKTFLRLMGATDEDIAAQTQALARPTGDVATWAREVVWYGRRGTGKRRAS